MSSRIAQKTDAENFSDETEKELQLVSFKLGEEEFGVDILQVKVINRMVEITRMPEPPAFVEGVIKLRDKLIPVVNLRKRIGLPEHAYDKDTRIIIVELKDQWIGFVVDAVSEVFRIQKRITAPPPSMAAGMGEEYITAIGKLEDRLLILLDLDKVLSTEEQVAFKKAA